LVGGFKSSIFSLKFVEKFWFLSYSIIEIFQNIQ
jgi:hypothetical protein